MDEVSEALRTFLCQAEGSRQLIGPKPPRSRGRFDKSRSLGKEERVTRERADVGERSEYSRSRAMGVHCMDTTCALARASLQSACA